MSVSFKAVLASDYGTSPKEIIDIEAKLQDFKERLGLTSNAASKVSSRSWTDLDFEDFQGVNWVPADEPQLARISCAWIKSLVSNENLHRLPELTAYLALHYPQVDNFAKPAIALLGKDYRPGTIERSGFSDIHDSDLGSEDEFATDKMASNAEFVRFKAWYDALAVQRQVAFAGFLALGMVQLCNKTPEDVLSYVHNHSMHEFQSYWGVPANTLLWIPLRSLVYLQSYFKPGSQLLVTVLRPFLNLRKQLTETSRHASLLDSLDSVIFSPTKGKGLALVRVFRDVLRVLDVTREQLLNEMPHQTLTSSKRLEQFTEKYGVADEGSWYWAQHFSKDFFAEFDVQCNKKAMKLLSALVGDGQFEQLEEDEKAWVTGLRERYRTKRERATSASYEGFWDGARRLDYV